MNTCFSWSFRISAGSRNELMLRVKIFVFSMFSDP